MNLLVPIKNLQDAKQRLRLPPGLDHMRQELAGAGLNAPFSQVTGRE